MSAGGQRIDKWLFFARLVKTRGLAQELAQSGKMRLNREKISQAARLVRPGDVLTFPLHERVRVLKVRAPGMRRGPASEAVGLYEDLSPPPERSAASEAEPVEASIVRSPGRPSRRDRRQAERLDGRDED